LRKLLLGIALALLAAGCPRVAVAQSCVFTSNTLLTASALNGCLATKFDLVNGGTVAGPLTLTTAGQNTLQNGSLYIGNSDFRRATFWAAGAGNQIAQLSRIGSSDSDVAEWQSVYVVNHNGGTPGNLFNTTVSTGAGGAPAKGVWNFLANLTTTSAFSSITGTPTQVAGYSQAVRTAITGGAKGVALEGHVVEYHDYVDQPTSVRGFGIGLEVDVAANNNDDVDVTGMASFDLSLANPSGTDLVVGNGIGFFGSSHTTLKRVFQVNVPFSQAILDARTATQGASANAIWLASNQTIALSTDGKWAIRSNPSGSGDLEWLYNGGVLGFWDTLSQFHASGGVVAGGAITATSYKIGSNQVVGARDTGWGVATGGSKAAFAASSATLAQTAAAVAQVINALTTHGLIGP
jgi:hypothetical protein